jgi:hypothetical protein
MPCVYLASKCVTLVLTTGNTGAQDERSLHHGSADISFLIQRLAELQKSAWARLSTEIRGRSKARHRLVMVGQLNFHPAVEFKKEAQNAESNPLRRFPFLWS